MEEHVEDELFGQASSSSSNIELLSLEGCSGAIFQVSVTPDRKTERSKHLVIAKYGMCKSAEVHR